MQRRILAACCAVVAVGVGVFTACVGDSSTPPTDTPDGGPSGSEAGPNADGSTPATDGGGNNVADTGTTTDAGPAACDPTKAFNAPSTAALTALNVTRPMVPMLNQFAPRLSADELTIYYSEGPGTVGGGLGSDVLSATRNAAFDSFGGGSPVLSIDSQYEEREPSLAPDGLSIFYTVNRVGKTLCMDLNFCIAQAFRGSTSAGFTDAGIVIDNAASSEMTPYAVGKGSTLYYGLRSPATNDFDLTSTSGPGAFINVNSTFEDLSPVLTPDELTLYFATNRGSDGGTDHDIWVATRKLRTDVFDPPTRVDALSSASDELPGYVSADGCRMYMTRDDGATGGQNLYFAAKGK